MCCCVVGWFLGRNKTRRIYRELGLQWRSKSQAKGQGQTAGGSPASNSIERDFVHDQSATGRKMRVLTIIDTLSRYSPALEARF
jgi:putative transposase